MYGVEKFRTTSYHPSTNGQCERFNSTMHRLLKTLSPKAKRQWPEHLAEMMYKVIKVMDDCDVYKIGKADGSSSAKWVNRAELKPCPLTVTASLHWLPMEYRVRFKLYNLTYKALQPLYLSSYLHPYNCTHKTSSPDMNYLQVPVL
jgi:hypothetical protein